MKTKNRTSTLLLIFLLASIFCLLISNVSYATDIITLNIQAERPYNDDNNDGTVGNDVYTLLRNGINKNVFKIGEKTSTGLKFERAMYCIRGGLGFGTSEGVISNEGVEYTLIGNLKTKSSFTIPKYKEITKVEISNENYNSILWILDNMYLPKNENAESMKATLLKKAEIEISDTVADNLTDDDIEVVQQIAIWYFSNYDENGNNESLSIDKGTQLYNILNINNDNVNDISEERAKKINKLYEYLKTNAKNNQAKYGEENNRTIETIEPTVSFKNTNPLIKKDSTAAMVGPFEIKKTEGNVDYKIDSVLLQDSKGNEIPQQVEGVPIYSVIQIDGVREIDKSSIEDVIGKGEFYIKIYEPFASGSYNLDKVELKLSYSGEYYETTSNLWISTDKDQPVVIVEKERKTFGGPINYTVAKIDGKFNLKILKTDELGNLLKGANFKTEDNKRTPLPLTDGKNGQFTSEYIKITKDGEEFIYDITEIQTPSGYIGLTNRISIKITTKANSDNTAYVIDTVQFIDSTGKVITIDEVKAEIDLETNTITITVENKKIKYFDLALRKYITKINNVALTGEEKREPIVIKSTLTTGTTATYNHKKNPVIIKTGDIVTYKITVYNEGDIDGKATKIVDQLPTGLKFKGIVSGNYELDNYDETTNRVAFKETSSNSNLLAYDGTTLNNTTIEIECEITATVTNNDQILTNVAWIAADNNTEETTVLDRDSSPKTIPSVDKDNIEDYTGNENKSDLNDSDYYYKGQEDDDDFEKLILEGKYFDLALRKYITKINDEQLSGEEARIPNVDTSKLKDATATTAKYTHSKDEVVVKKGDIVTYKIRIYNEGKRDGYATEIADYIPEGLGMLLNYNTNLDNLWHIDSTSKTMNLVGDKGFYSSKDKVKNLKILDFTGVEDLSEVKIVIGNTKITTTALDDELIKAYDKEVVSNDVGENEKWQKSSKGEDGLYYEEVEIACIVLKDNTFTGTLKNIAEISKAEDESHTEIINKCDDRDSVPNNVDTESYNPPVDNSSYQEDDDDYEPLVLRYFDLALRKFITKIEDTDVTTRIPEVSVDKDGNITYNHDKTPLYVANSDIVTYTIRVYNEGSIDGYAEIVSDDIPDGLEFLPQNETNKTYMWEMYYEEDGELVKTEDIEKATSIRTTYLSEANGKINNIITEGEPIQENSNLLKGFDRTKMNIPDYRDIKVAFKVVEKDIPETNIDRIIINKAQISEDSDDDEDSIPDEWNEGEDDQDKEYVYVREFDLSLLKWVTTSIVTVDGKTTTTSTGFTPNIGETEYTKDSFQNIRDNSVPEPIAKVEINRRKIKSTVVKFVYKIRVTNEGDLEGYATEITDYIPEGLEFVAEDNPLWKKDGDDKVTTRALETKLLKPGESAELEITFRWINGEKNLGQKINVAEISEDYNEKDSEDIDSTPDTIKIGAYEKEIEDDDDYALVLLSISTGDSNVATGYTLIVLIVLTIITSGVIAIKKYVL